MRCVQSCAGTHFIAHAEFGSYVRVSINATRTVLSAWAVQGVDTVQAAADMARRYCNSSFELSVDGMLVDSSVPAAQLSFSVWPALTPGELPCDQPAAWWQSVVLAEPAVLWGTLSPISNLLSSFYFPNEPQLKRKRQALADEVRARTAARGLPSAKVTPPVR